LTEIREDADIPGKFLVFKSDFSAIRAVELATEDACTPQQRVVALDFPTLDCGDVECKTPD